MSKWEWFLQMEAALFDLDGCLYYGERLAEGAVELLCLLNEKGLRASRYGGTPGARDRSAGGSHYRGSRGYASGVCG
ncbi:hypothetical protein [Paenibacillus sp. J5C2022]|uniref:hypothetical protein n=1 Tax=Paenibacillus sp. J5C2022 TaxID=2977129 RepID=UPI0021D32500|nr:hypothetical protein [Paenibacillus sp. J5C2022]